MKWSQYICIGITRVPVTELSAVRWMVLTECLGLLQLSVGARPKPNVVTQDTFTDFYYSTKCLLPDASLSRQMNRHLDTTIEKKSYRKLQVVLRSFVSAFRSYYLQEESYK
jgi:hypothetical protein